MHTEFGRINPRHAHDWTFLDRQLFIIEYLVLMHYVARFTFELVISQRVDEFHFGLQNPNGETMTSFLAMTKYMAKQIPAGAAFVQRDVRGIDDMVKLLRWDQAWELDDNANLKLGLSWLSGPNATGADADTTIQGLDLVYKKNWFTDEGDRRALIFEGEYIDRDFDLAGTTTQLEDKGFFGKLVIKN